MLYRRPHGWRAHWHAVNENHYRHDSGLLVRIDGDAIARPENMDQLTRANDAPAIAIISQLRHLLAECTDFHTWRKSKIAYDEAKRKADPSWRPKNEI